MHDVDKRPAQIIVMLSEMAATFGDRFDKIDQRLLGVENKIAGVDRSLDAEAVRRTERKLPRRVHDLEEKAYGIGRSRHPKHLSL
jgi:hypothetical protein